MKDKDFLKYNTTTNVYNISQTVPKAKFMNGFLATNIGDTIVTVNRKILFPSATPATSQGDAVSFGGNAGEIYIQDIDISFAAPAGVIPRVEIVQKFYPDVESGE